MTDSDTFNPTAGDRRCSACTRIPWDPRVWDILARYNRRKLSEGDIGTVGPFHYRSECELEPKYKLMAVDSTAALQARDSFHQRSECLDDLDHARRCMRSDFALGNGDVEGYQQDTTGERRFEEDHAEGLGGLRHGEAKYLESLLEGSSATESSNQQDSATSTDVPAWGDMVQYFQERLTVAPADSRLAAVFQKNPMQEGKMMLYFDHHADISALKRAAAAGCQLCRTFRTLVRSRWYNDDMPRERACTVKILLSDSSQEPGRVIFEIGRRYEAGIILEEVPSWLQTREDVPVQTWKDTVEDDLQKLVADVIHPWVQDCDTGVGAHEKCFPSEDLCDLPTRLIDVGLDAEGSVRLVVTDQATGSQKYTILSYCWGTSNDTARTTRFNFPERRVKIDTQTLPQTIQDAIKLTRAMGIRYLWVDALCIIQSHQEDIYLEDFFQEAPKMGSYYSNAYCLISALAASDSSQGLFMNGQVGGLDTKPRLIGYDKSQDTAWVIENSAIIMELEARNHTPALERGWCLQERLLARRILQWTTAGAFWQCKGIEASELRPQPTTLSTGGYKPLLAREYDGILTESSSQRALAELWPNLIKVYQLMKLGQETDRLNAIQGLGNRLAEIHNDVYFHGLFFSHAAQGLLWQGLKRPEAHGSANFPSWSWGTADRTNFYKPDVSLIQDISCHATETASSKDPNDRFKAGRELKRLRLRAPLIDLHGIDLPTGKKLYKSATWKFRNFDVDFHFDEEDLIPGDSSPIQILLLGHSKQLNPLAGIAVRTNGADCRYLERIGYVSIRTDRTEGDLSTFFKRYMTTVDLI